MHKSLALRRVHIAQSGRHPVEAESKFRQWKHHNSKIQWWWLTILRLRVQQVRKCLKTLRGRTRIGLWALALRKVLFRDNSRTTLSTLEAKSRTSIKSKLCTDRCPAWTMLTVSLHSFLLLEWRRFPLIRLRTTSTRSLTNRRAACLISSLLDRRPVHLTHKVSARE